MTLFDRELEVREPLFVQSLGFGKYRYPGLVGEAFSLVGDPKTGLDFDLWNNSYLLCKGKNIVYIRNFVGGALQPSYS